MVADVYREQLRLSRERKRRRRLEEEHRQGLEEGRREERARWMAWLDRREAAIRENRPFDEPPPGGWEGVDEARAKLSRRRASGSRPVACL